MDKYSNLLQSLFRFIRSPGQKDLVAYISLVAFGVKFLVSITINSITNQDSVLLVFLPELGSILFFCILGLAGMIVIIRKELPQAIVVRGNMAVVIGLIWLVISWLLMCRALYLLAVDV